MDTCTANTRHGLPVPNGPAHSRLGVFRGVSWKLRDQESPLSSYSFSVSGVLFSSDCKDWGYSSEVMSTGCSSRVAALDSQYRSSQPSVTQVLGDPMPLSCLSTVCTWYTNTYVGKTHRHIKIKRSES
jgi:hypothetical protein